MRYRTLKPFPKVLFLFFNIMVWCSCTATKDIVGTYRSRFASLGFFITTIQLNQDSTLQHNFRGDLINRNAQGYFKRKGDTLLLYYAYNDEDFKNILAGFPQERLKLVKIENTLGHKESYLVGRGKLFPINIETGKVTKREVQYHKTKKYIIAGSHYYKDKFYMVRLESTNPN